MDDAPELIQHSKIELNSPVVIAACRGWNDAGEAATFAAHHLARVWSAERFASLDPEDFYDFQVARPHVQLVEGVTRKIVWPGNDFFAARMPGAPHDVIAFVGTEPN